MLRICFTQWSSALSYPLILPYMVYCNHIIIIEVFSTSTPNPKPPNTPYKALAVKATTNIVPVLTTVKALML